MLTHYLHNYTHNKPTTGEERLHGITTQEGHEVEAKAVVITTGTFLRGVVHLGRTNYAAGKSKFKFKGLSLYNVGILCNVE